MSATQDSGAHRPVLFIDFDGVLNFTGSVARYRETPGALGDVRETALSVGQFSFRIQWSAELVRELADLKERAPFDWLWLTTWREHAVAQVDPALGTPSDGYVPWSSGAVSMPWADSASSRKYDALMETLSVNPRPFVWVDDTATPAYDAADFVGDLDVPHLVVAPSTDVGLLCPDVDAIAAFLLGLQDNDGRD